MKNSSSVDAARLSLLLNELRLPAIKVLWPQFAEQADKEGWPAARFLSAIAEHELSERDRRRIERHLAEARLPPGKTIDSFDFDVVQSSCFRPQPHRRKPFKFDPCTSALIGQKFTRVA